MNPKFLLCLSVLVISSGIMPVYAEVTQIQLDKPIYEKNESINVSGNVEEDSSGLVSIVVRDPADNFVLLSQAIITADNSFEQKIPINEKFRMTGIHNATAFIFNMTEAKTQSFEITSGTLNEITPAILQDIPEISNVQDDLRVEPEKILPLEDFKDELVPEPIIQPSQTIQTPEKSLVADFVDTSKDPQYYLDRYYNEPSYKAWFDRNYPNITIEDAVGYTYFPTESPEPTTKILSDEIIPKAEASSITIPSTNLEDDTNMNQVLLVIGGAVILFGVAYWIKRKITSKWKNISISNGLKQKITSPKSDSNLMKIIQTRLAKGEITLEEYEDLKEKLEKNPKL